VPIVLIHFLRGPIVAHNICFYGISPEIDIIIVEWVRKGNSRNI
jgi:hypothetical protein